MLKTMKYLKAFGISMIRRPRKVHAETTEESFDPVSVTCVQAGEDDEDISARSIYESTFRAADSSSDDDCESLLSDDTVYGRRYRTVRLYGIVDPGLIPEGLASTRTSARDPRTSTVLDVLDHGRAPIVRWLQMSHARGDIDSDLFSLSSLSTRYVEESAEASNDEDWEHNSHVSGETK
eukprot:TRINITY_DN13575_c0_g2_i1.p1 TRINITY_DN13575_c0_g2~~TRINITY_DN13575_c0_g2_i1.p1  ORF type:complete len:198 (-),score=15.92 TRINITY_DN13575_c0_g2_i1:112-648(-)